MPDSSIARRLLPVFAVLAIGVAVLLSVKALEEAGSQPTVVFVVMDTLRADRASLCGYARPTTPSLEKLVELGASYACRSHSPSTWTLPSHATFFTGLGSEEHQAGIRYGAKKLSWETVTPLDARYPTLAEEMAARGYQTLLLSGNPVVSEESGLTRGFAHAVVAQTYPEMHGHRLAQRLKLILHYLALDRDKPLFVFINIADPHSPWRAIPPGLGFLPARAAMTPNPQRRRFEAGELTDAEAERWLSHLSDVYDYSVLRADRSLAATLEVLEADGWLERGYRLVVTSDHGEYLGEHQMVEHGRRFFYEPVTRVPLVYLSTEGQIELPEDVPSSVAHSLVLDGALPEVLPPNVASVFRNGPASADSTLPCSLSTAALWVGESKLVADQGQVFSYELSRDPNEEQPIPAGDHPAAAELLEHCRALDRAAATRPAPDAELSKELSAQLKALGYLSDDEESPNPQAPGQ
ncbi:MAG: sulfatase-like hydrolase/transferase, partial [Polyangiales bacterium]